MIKTFLVAHRQGLMHSRLTITTPTQRYAVVPLSSTESPPGIPLAYMLEIRRSERKTDTPFLIASAPALLAILTYKTKGSAGVFREWMRVLPIWLTDGMVLRIAERRVTRVAPQSHTHLLYALVFTSVEVRLVVT